jgi:hypothetical protein
MYATTMHFTFFCLFGSLVGEGAISVSVCFFLVEKVNFFFVCQLSIEINGIQMAKCDRNKCMP